MNFDEWKKYYREILKEFNFSEEKDIESGRILDIILEERDLKSVKNEIINLIKNREVFVFGAGPSLSNGIKKFSDLIVGKTTISADGATTALLENNIIPNIIVTDLDGKIGDLIHASELGSIIVLHAHGDNIERIKEYGRTFRKIFGTTQADPSNFKNLLNFGGFTDGDRAVYLAKHFGAEIIYLIGFDFNGVIGEYSFTKNIEIKRKKLMWCKKLIDYIDNVVFLK